MALAFLNFEQPIAELEAKIEGLRQLGSDSSVDINDEIAKLQSKNEELTKSIYAKLEPMQVVQVARHPQRPYTLDYIEHIFTDFDEMHGDRHFAEGSAIVGGTARLNGQPVMVIGHQKGRKTKDNLYRNFGMPKPEGYRKALRLMQTAERFKLPIYTFIDTPGAYPGIGAEERNQSEAIARNLFEMSKLRTPVICTVTGEGGSGGALALGVGDSVLMLQYSVYSVISPEGCASILWRDAAKAAEAATALGCTSEKIKELGLIDEIVAEPLGGAHRDVEAMAAALKTELLAQYDGIKDLSIDELIQRRYDRLMALGVYQ